MFIILYAVLSLFLVLLWVTLNWVASHFLLCLSVSGLIISIKFLVPEFLEKKFGDKNFPSLLEIYYSYNNFLKEFYYAVYEAAYKKTGNKTLSEAIALLFLI